MKTIKKEMTIKTIKEEDLKNQNVDDDKNKQERLAKLQLRFADSYKCFEKSKFEEIIIKQYLLL